MVVAVHPEPSSFTHSWARASVEAVGGTVILSDLYAMEFDPAERGALYGADGPFDAMEMQDHAARAGTLPPDVAAEIDKIRRADLVIFHFPLWWFGPPAMLKGWFDRVLAHGALHTSRARFDTGMCRGKRALFCVTTGASAAESGPSGKEGDTRLHLWPLAYALRYLGFDVFEPVLVHGVHGFHTGAARDAMEAHLGEVLARHPQTLATLGRRPVIPFNRDDAFDAEGRLRPDAPSYSPFIRHE